jgi:hypothetical protein
MAKTVTSPAQTYAYVKWAEPMAFSGSCDGPKPNAHLREGNAVEDGSAQLLVRGFHNSFEPSLSQTCITMTNAA